jgi:hypothetical protein
MRKKELPSPLNVFSCDGNGDSFVVNAQMLYFSAGEAALQLR